MSERKLPSGNALLFTGIALIVLGLVAIFSPAWAGKMVIYLVGALLLITGIFQFLVGWNDETKAGQVGRMTLGILTGLAGIALLAHPIYGAAALGLVLAIFFLLEGIWKIVTSFSYRPARGWLAFLGSGLLALVLAWMIWKQWPLSGEWAVGILVGVDLLSTGLSLVTIALTLKAAVTALQDRADQIREKLSS